MRTRFAVVMAAVVMSGGLWLTAAPGWAHHAFSAEFDASQPIQLQGTVTRFELINPHAWIHIDVTGQDGQVVRWMIEGGAPNALIRRGFTQRSLAVGTEILVDGYRAKDGANRANGKDITFPDGRKLFVGSSGTGAPYDPTRR
jgi:hypothetical protein